MSDEVNSLIEQLKTNNKVAKEASKNEEAFNLDKEELEQFVLNSSGKLIQDSMGMIDNMKEYISAGSSADDIHAFSELFKASTQAMEILNKILIQNKRGQTTKEVKQMDIESKQSMHQDKVQATLISRDEVVKQLIDNAKLIDAEVIED
jgi:hypothetical protein